MKGSATARIDHDEGGVVIARGLDAIDQRGFGVGLETRQRVSGGCRAGM